MVFQRRRYPINARELMRLGRLGFLKSPFEGAALQRGGGGEFPRVGSTILV